jgi:minor extracellular serine protease Vpr
MSTLRRVELGTVAAALLAVAGLAGTSGCEGAAAPEESASDDAKGAGLQAGGQDKVDLLLRLFEAKGASPGDAASAMPGGLVSAHAGSVRGQAVVMVDVLIEGDVSALPELAGLDVAVRTVTSSGIMTASLPLPRLNAVAALPSVTRISAAKRVQKYNDNSNALVAGTHSYGMNNDRSHLGEGVVVGVIDSGLDWTHEDFIDDDTGASRIAYYWDQSDISDSAPPGGFTYGREYEGADFDAYNAGNTSAVAASARDTDGHGTHVTGTAAGDGSASGGQYRGVAPAAEIVFVKFDFDGSRNSTAAIVDGVSYIFQKARALGKPAVINMSLGSDFGPGDGSGAEERGIDDLTGPGNVVVVAAGNPGANNWSDPLAWGFSLHGSGALGGADPITFRYPSNLISKGKSSTVDYAFFDIWHDGGTCKVTVSYEGTAICSLSSTTSPGRVGSCRTSVGTVLIGQSTDVLGFESDSGDTEVYVELPPATGTFSVDLTNCSGEYHAKYGTSANVVHQWRDEPLPRNPTPQFGGRESDNAYTIGSPASATNVLAVAAYQSRDSWQYVYGTTDAACDGTTVGTQSYGVDPINYYDPYSLGQLAYFSARGPRRDGVVKPDIATPGVGIASAFSSFTKATETDKCTSYWDGGFYHYGTNRVLPGEQYMVIQGTSMACPNATGAVAVLLQKKPDLDAAQLRDLFALTARADDAVTVYENAANTSGTDTDTDAASLPNNDWGYGKLDVTDGLGGLASCEGSCVYDSDCGAGTCTLGGSLTECSSCTACVPTGAEVCNGIDDDCNGIVDDGLGTVSCGVGACARTVDACADGSAQACVPGSPSPEVCDDNIDNDCDGARDAADPDCAGSGGSGGGCTLGQLGATCSSNSDCCSNNCKGKPGAKVCK